MNILEKDEEWMSRAIELAKLGSSHTLPNPMVGCVIVLDNQVISEGYHEKFGEAHAEVNALAKIPEYSIDQLRKATAYINLEPCNCFGKTPPCVDLLISRNVGRVVCAMKDPNPKVFGLGFTRLREAGIEVVVGVLEEEALELNRKFIALQDSNFTRPYITLKWAQSSDGYIDPEVKAKKNRGSYPITSSQTQKAVHKLRADNTAILVGRRTVDVDNPSLSVRFTEGNNPTRIIVDPRLELDYSSLKMNSEKGETWVLCNDEQHRETSNSKEEEVVGIKILPWLNLATENWLKKLRNAGVHSILVEGGTFTLQKFLDSDCYDDIEIFISDKELGGGLMAPELPDTVSGQFKETHVGEDKMKLYIRKC
jgi:diaminohydroxyphosphoribosylaminopyrimidine deaminase / 5-amino-6-(5-phosphoribosylamino)uracil reductase